MKQERVYLSLGSNIGDRYAYLAHALYALRDLSETTLISVASCYETTPVGPIEQDLFLNTACCLTTTLEPQDLLHQIHNIETRLNRHREQRYGPRTIDIDIICFGQRSLVGKQLTIPHPRLKERLFVLIPIKELGITDILGFNVDTGISALSTGTDKVCLLPGSSFKI